ncbi:hypothetical protein Tco_0579648 [Tanacetum coccineum]
MECSQAAGLLWIYGLLMDLLMYLDILNAGNAFKDFITEVLNKKDFLSAGALCSWIGFVCEMEKQSDQVARFVFDGAMMIRWQDLFHLYDLMREQYLEVTLDGFELILWGDLKIMMESSTEGNEQSDFWSGQQDWKIVTWRLYESCGVCILEFEDGIVIHKTLLKKIEPLSKIYCKGFMILLEVERESSVALDLIRFIKQQIDEE